MRKSQDDTNAQTTWSARQPPTRSPADNAERTPGTGRPAQLKSGELRRAVMVGTLALPLAGAATWYGFLESEGAHPSLKLGGAMALAGIGMVLLVVARPVQAAPPVDGEHGHSALVEVHPILLGLAGASMSAALIHFAVIEQHLAEYWLYGWFFVAVAIAQLAWALAAVIRPARLLLLTGAVGNGLVAVVWAVTRAYGSLIGPEATERAAVGFGDVASTLLEAAIVAGCLGVLAAPRILDAGSSRRGEVASTVIVIGLTLLTVLGLYSAVAGSPFVSPVG